ncbi:MAG: MFS transporter [Phycisphaerales bacterium]|nr:MFS transporter [Phycisphaerales bacterium]
MSTAAPSLGTGRSGISSNPYIFATCFIALIATAFGFMVRIAVMDTWQVEFNLSETQKGEIFGVGLWPFAISIILFSLVIDRIGYTIAMWFAFFCHLAQVLLLITADGYWGLWIGTFIGALGNGTIEAVINPVIASIYHRNKTKWLTILHAGWPGGLVLAGLLAIAVGAIELDDGSAVGWRWQIGLILIPVILYGLMLLSCRFPVSERVAAGVSYRAMLQEAGIFGCLIVTALIVAEFGRVFGIEPWLQGDIILFVCVCYGMYVLAFGRGIFILLLLIMIPLATTELGTDSWIKELMAPITEKWEINGAWVLVYTAFIMMVLRFCVGPIVKALGPLGILAVCSVFAAVGIYGLANMQATAWIIIAATVYGIGQTFFWPCTLGVVAEQFPRGGALTLNAIAGVGMLGVGIIGAPLLGNLQDNQVHNKLVATDPGEGLGGQLVLDDSMQTSVFGEYRKIDQDKLARLEEADAEAHADILALQQEGKMTALELAAIPPIFMAICYLLLMLYYRSQGGYKPVDLGVDELPAEEDVLDGQNRFITSED